MSSEVKIRIVVDDRGSPVLKAFARKASRDMNQAAKAVDRASQEISRSLQGTGVAHMARQFAALALSLSRFSDTARRTTSGLASYLQAIEGLAPGLERALAQAHDQLHAILRVSLQPGSTAAEIMPLAMGAMGGLAPIGGPMSALVMEALKLGGRGLNEALSTTAEFERALSGTAALIGATREEMKRLAAAAREMGAQSVFSATEAAQAQYYLASAGMSVNQIIQAQKGVMELAAATQSDLAFTAEAVTSALSQFGLKASEASRVANVYAAAISGSQATMAKLSDSMRYVGPIAAQMGQSIEQTVAQLMALYNAGLRGEQAGTGLRAVMLRLQSPTAEARRALERLGVSLTDSQGRARPLMAIMRDLGKAHMSAKDAAAIFGTEAASVALILAGAADKVARYREEITGTAKASEMAAIQTDNLWGDFQRLKSSFEELAISIGEKLAPSIRTLTKAVIYFNTEIVKNQLLLPAGLPLKEQISLVQKEIEKTKKKLADIKEEAAASEAGLHFFGIERNLEERLKNLTKQLEKLRRAAGLDKQSLPSPSADLASIANEIEDNASRALRRVSTQAHHTANSLNKVKDNMLAVALAAARAAGAEEWGASWQGLEERLHRAELERYQAKKRAHEEYTRLMLRLTGTAEQRKRYEMAQTLAKYKRLLDEGLITEEQYLQVRRALNEDYNRWLAERHKGALERMIEGWLDWGRAVDELTRQSLSGIRQAFVGFWRDVFEGGKNAWESLWNALKSIAINALAELATIITTRLFARVLSGLVPGLSSLLGPLVGSAAKAAAGSVLGSAIGATAGAAAGGATAGAAVGGAAAAAGPASIAADWAGINAEISAAQTAAGAQAGGWAIPGWVGPAAGMWAGLEGFAAIAGVPGPAETLFNAVGSILGFGEEGHYTPAEAMARMQATLESFSRMVERLGELPLERVNDLAGELEMLAEKAGMTTEQFHAMVEATDPVLAKWTEAAIVTDELDRRIDSLVQEADRLAYEMSYSGNSAAELRQRLLALVEALHLPQDQASALAGAIRSLVGAWSEGSMSAESLAEALRARFAGALRAIAADSATTAATIRALAEAIRAVPTHWETRLIVHREVEGVVGHAGGFVAHSGGYVPRLHYGGWAWGLRPDEVPAILQRGEFVLSRGDVARLGGPAAVEALRRQGPGRHVSIQVEGPLVVVEGESDPQAIAEAVRGVLEEMATHGEAVGVANAVEVGV